MPGAVRRRVGKLVHQHHIGAGGDRRGRVEVGEDGAPGLLPPSASPGGTQLLGCRPLACGVAAPARLALALPREPSQPSVPCCGISRSLTGAEIVGWRGVRENRGVTESGVSASQFSLRTVWARRLETPLRRFLRTETGSAAVLLAATLAALVWANIDPAGYAATWHTVLLIRSGTAVLADSWQGWVNSGLMAFFFLVAGLEARREFDLGELRERRRLALPLVVALGGMVVPIAIYLAINAGRSSAAGWGTAMATDTAFALGMLALVGPGVPDRVRTYLLTFALAADMAGIVIIALAYSGHIDLTALGAGAALLGAVIVARWRGGRN